MRGSRIRAMDRASPLARCLGLLCGLGSLTWLLQALLAAPEHRPELLGIGLLLLPAQVERGLVLAARRARLRLLGLPFEGAALLGLTAPLPAWTWLAAWACAAVHLPGWGRYRLAGLAATPGALGLSLGQASCTGALLGFSLVLALSSSIARLLAEHPPLAHKRGAHLLGFLAAGAALLAAMLLALPAPHWLGSATDGRQAVLLALSILAGTGVAAMIACSSRADPARTTSGAAQAPGLPG